jgi:ADP-heptose:LPS heptosyltransferase
MPTTRRFRAARLGEAEHVASELRVDPTGAPVRRIAVLRALQLGDLLCSIPALRALRRAAPEAEVTLIGLPWARELVDRFDQYLDRFLELHGFPGLPELPFDARAFPEFLARAHGHAFDLVLQLHGSGESSNVLALLLGGRRTAGFYGPGAYCPDGETFVPYPDALAEPRRLLGLLEALGAEVVDDELEFPLRDADRRALAALRRRHRIDGPYAVVHPGARSARAWSPENFAAVADALARNGLSVVLTGTDAERSVTGAVATAMTAAAVDLAGETTLGTLGALLADARLVICNDTGVSHLAAAVRVPSVVIFTTSDARRWAPLDVRRHRAVRESVARTDTILREAEEALRAG